MQGKGQVISGVWLLVFLTGGLSPGGLYLRGDQCRLIIVVSIQPLRALLWRQWYAGFRGHLHANDAAISPSDIRPISPLCRLWRGGDNFHRCNPGAANGILDGRVTHSTHTARRLWWTCGRRWAAFWARQSSIKLLSIYNQRCMCDTAFISL